VVAVTPVAVAGLALKLVAPEQLVGLDVL
jgi:hypothetical protein